VDAVNRRGRTIEVRVVCTALIRHGDANGVILVMDPVDGVGDDGSPVAGQGPREPGH
jgi:hypothetical protein